MNLLYFSQLSTRHPEAEALPYKDTARRLTTGDLGMR